MIEIGLESKATRASRRLAEAFGGMAALLLLVWLIRGFLGIEVYSTSLLLSSFVFILLGRGFRTRTRSGLGRAVSSFLWNLTAASIIILILIWFLGWLASIQAGVMPTSISTRIPDLVIASVTTGLGAYAAGKLSPERRWSAGGTLFISPSGKGPTTGDISLMLKGDTVGVPIKRYGRPVGCVLFGDVSASFATPMGPVTALVHGPITSVGIPFQGTKASKTDVSNLVGKTPKQLELDASSNMAGLGLSDSSLRVDLPFVHVSEDAVERSVEVGPVRVHDGPGGEHIRIGPFSVDSGDDWGRWGSKRHRRWWRNKWIARGVSDSYVEADGRRTYAKWNGSSLSLDDGTMKLSVGSDSFSYTPNEVKTSSPLHMLQVTQEKVALDTRKFTLKVSGDMVFLRTEVKSSTTESKALANDLRTLLTETAKKQVGDVMEGTPIDLSEMLASTEEVLARHG